MSFGQKYGKPHEATHVFDVRLLPNPARHSRRCSGTSAKLQKEFFVDEEVQRTFASVLDDIQKRLERGEVGGDTEVDTWSFAVGCEEGMHRSVAFVEHLRSALRTSCLLPYSTATSARSAFVRATLASINLIASCSLSTTRSTELRWVRTDAFAAQRRAAAEHDLLVVHREWGKVHVCRKRIERVVTPTLCITQHT
jgi:hypothetical protein